ncbi:MAG: AraC family transcriptional regulator [Kiloniellaceae bacterium]
MDYLKRYRVLESRDLDALRDCAARQGAPIDLQLEGPRRGFDARFSSAPLDTLSLLHATYGTVRSRFGTRAEQPEDAFLICLLTEGAGRFEQHGAGWDMGQGGAVMRDLRRPATAVQDGFACFALKLPVARLRRQAEALYGPAAGNREVRFDCGAALDTAAGRRFRDTLHFLAAQLDADEGFAGTLAAAAWEDLLLTLLLEAVPNDWAAEGEGCRRATVLPYHVKRARDHIHAHLGEKITLADLAAAAGCGYRTLQSAFAEATGLPPMAYLKAVRLQAAHEALAAAGPKDGVAAVARAWGFGHPGRFAVDYRRRFGCSPTETLRTRR